MTGDVLGSILVGSADPLTLRAFYEAGFASKADDDGFLNVGGVEVLVDRRDDVSSRATDPHRLVLNVHVDRIRPAFDRAVGAGAEVVVAPEWRGDAWFATLCDPDGNTFQLIEFSPSYFEHKGISALGHSDVSSRLPAQDLDRARTWYAEKLDLHPLEERPGGLRFRCGSGSFALYESDGRSSGDHTQMSWTVDDLDQVVADLRGRGVQFEDIDSGGLRTNSGIAEVDGNYPSLGGIGERGAWFRDSEGNLLALGEPVRPPSEEP